MRAFLGFLVILLGAAARRGLRVGLHRSPERAGARARVRQAQAGRRNSPACIGSCRSVETVDIFDKRILDIDTQTQEVTASDQKRLLVDVFARYKIVDPLKFYQTLRDERDVRSRLGPIVESAHAARARRGDVPGRGARQARASDEADPQQRERRRRGLRAAGGGRAHQARRPSRAEPEERVRSHARRTPARGNRVPRPGHGRSEPHRGYRRSRSHGHQGRSHPQGRGAARRRAKRSATASSPRPSGTTPTSSASTARCRPTSRACSRTGRQFVLSPDSEFFEYFNNPLGTGTAGQGTTARPPQ